MANLDSVCLALGGCQTGPASVSNEPCPNINPCDDTDSRLLPAAPTRRPATVPVAARLTAGLPLWPGCPATLQVMAPPRPIAFQSVHPVETPKTTGSDPSDWVCEGPEAPLLRAAHPGKRDLAIHQKSVTLTVRAE